MKMIISPAKSLNFNRNLPTEKKTIPFFQSEANKINKILRKSSPIEISYLMNISENLANLNWERNQNFSSSAKPSNSGPAAYVFNGDVYSGIDVYSLSNEKIEKMQNSLRILSGLYGILKPLDLIQPYRLEMGTNLKIDNKKNLYQFWSDRLTNFLNKELIPDELFINLASNEYFSAINYKLLNTNVITPQFKDFKNGKLKVISFFAKKARGMMVRYLLDLNKVSEESFLKFNLGGYIYSENHSESKFAPVFIR